MVAKRNNILLVYKALYFSNPYNNRPKASPIEPFPDQELIPNRTTDPGRFRNNTVLQSSLCIYDTSMRLLQEKILPLPKQITGVHFLVYENFFYLFYQYREGNLAYCMAEKIGMDGVPVGKPIEMDKIRLTGILYQDQIYSVIYSEDKQQVLCFNLNIHHPPVTIINSILFDKDLHPVRRLIHRISIPASEHLSEFSLDNEGGFLFVGLAAESQVDAGQQVALFTLRRDEDSLSFSYIVPSSIWVDDIRLIVDNRHKRYILTSFYSPKRYDPIAGLFTIVRDANGRITDHISQMILADSIRKSIGGKSANPKRTLDSYYIQNIYPGQDGGFVVAAQELSLSPDLALYGRWDYPTAFSERGFFEYDDFDAYEHDHYFPWKEWHYLNKSYGFTSRGVFIARFDTAAVVDWVNTLNMPQVDWVHATIGYKNISANGLLYFLYNVNIRRNSYLTAQSIDPDGELNTDSRLKEDVALKDQNSNYVYFPRLAKLVDDGEVIVPCRLGHYVCLAKVDF